MDKPPDPKAEIASYLEAMFGDGRFVVVEQESPFGQSNFTINATQTLPGFEEIRVQIGLVSHKVSTDDGQVVTVKTLADVLKTIGKLVFEMISGHYPMPITLWENG